MCDLCAKVKASPEYRELLVKMGERDAQRLEHSKANVDEFASISAYSTIDYPKLLVQPMFEPKVAFATPITYFQNLFVNDEKLPGNFTHGSTRSIFFLGKRLIVLSKSSLQHHGEEMFSSFLLAHFEPGEFRLEAGEDRKVLVSAEMEKPAKNLLSGKVEKIKISFAFAQDALEGKLMRKNEALGSTLFANQFKRAGADPRTWLNSTEYMFDYVSSVAHISPHPYMLKLMPQLGYSDQRDFQNHVADYFRAHLAERQ